MMHENLSEYIVYLILIRDTPMNIIIRNWSIRDCCTNIYSLIYIRSTGI